MSALPGSLTKPRITLSGRVSKRVVYRCKERVGAVRTQGFHKAGSLDTGHHGDGLTASARHISQICTLGRDACGSVRNRIDGVGGTIGYGFGVYIDVGDCCFGGIRCAGGSVLDGIHGAGRTIRDGISIYVDVGNGFFDRGLGGLGRAGHGGACCCNCSCSSFADTCGFCVCCCHRHRQVHARGRPGRDATACGRRRVLQMAAGASLIEAALDCYNLDHLEASDASLREGVLIARELAGADWREKLASLVSGD